LHKKLKESAEKVQEDKPDSGSELSSSDSEGTSLIILDQKFNKIQINLSSD